MTDRSVGPRCGNNPNVQLTDRDRKAIDDFKARLALKEAAKPYIERAVWVDGDPLMEVIAVTVWERCARDDENTPQLVCDDPRTIAAFAAAVACAHAAVSSAPADRAALSARLWAVAEHRIVAEWICCEPINPKHDLCVQGDATLRMVKALLVDDPEAIRPAPLLDAVLAVLPEPADRAAIYREVADRLAADAEQGEKEGFTRIYRRSAARQVRERADQAQQPETQADDTDPVYDPRAWETYRRDAGCGCTAPAPVDCKIPHGTGAWLCPCHRLSGPPWKDGDPSGKPLSPEDASIRQYFQEPNRCLSANGIFRCSRPTGHPGDHRTGRTFWGRRAEDEQPAAVSQPGKEG
jgi:hypothetical protein